MPGNKAEAASLLDGYLERQADRARAADTEQSAASSDAVSGIR